VILKGFGIGVTATVGFKIPAGRRRRVFVFRCAARPVNHVFALQLVEVRVFGFINKLGGDNFVDAVRASGDEVWMDGEKEMHVGESALLEFDDGYITERFSEYFSFKQVVQDGFELKNTDPVYHVAAFLYLLPYVRGYVIGEVRVCVRTERAYVFFDFRPVRIGGEGQEIRWSAEVMGDAHGV
jgi:hypothetical protein